MNLTRNFLAASALSGLCSLLLLTSCGKQQKGSGQSTTTNVSTPSGGARIAYVDIDTFEEHYENLKQKREELKAQKEANKAELERSYQQFQADYASVMQKQQQGTLTESEGKAAEKRLGQMQQSLKTREAALDNQYEENVVSFQKKMHDDMDAFLAEYVKDHPFDYVLSYSHSNPLILYANKGLNVTDDVIKGMNERAAKSGSSKDTARRR